MPHDPKTEGLTVLLKDEHGTHDMIVQKQHEAPYGENGSVGFDEFKSADANVASNMMKWLLREYPGYPWGCVSDLQNKIVKFNIPILMGMQNWWVINLTTTDIIDGLRIGAGQILERYRLRRGRFQLAPFLDARAKHSALVVPRRLVPE